MSPAAPDDGALAERLAALRPADYARSRNHLDGAVSGLSPWITHGALTLPQALAAAERHGPLPDGHRFVAELGWREFFRHVWAQRGDGILESLHAGPLPDAAYARELPADIRRGATGVPVVDRAVQTLYGTGTLHNHARLWLASYVVHQRKVHWRAGADWLYAHLLDGDLASNHLSWQWVAGTGSHQPYLFDAANVERFAPRPWHSRGTAVDRSYEELDAIARDATRVAPAGDARGGVDEPALQPQPPAAAGFGAPDAAAVTGRDVWLLHAWALRPPPDDLAPQALVVAVLPTEFHARRPWSARRWAFVGARMSRQTALRWQAPAAVLREALRGARSVQSVADPHLAGVLDRLATLRPAPALFAPVERPCTSFSQWWKRTRPLRTPAG